jgi:hypothetical protein
MPLLSASSAGESGTCREVRLEADATKKAGARSRTSASTVDNERDMGIL